MSGIAGFRRVSSAFGRLPYLQAASKPLGWPFCSIGHGSTSLAQGSRPNPTLIGMVLLLFLFLPGREGVGGALAPSHGFAGKKFGPLGPLRLGFCFMHNVHRDRLL